MNLIVKIECPTGRPTPDKHLYYIINILRMSRKSEIRLLSKYNDTCEYVISGVDEEMYDKHAIDIFKHFNILHHLGFIRYFNIQFMDEFLENTENLAD